MRNLRTEPCRLRADRPKVEVLTRSKIMVAVLITLGLAGCAGGADEFEAAADPDPTREAVDVQDPGWPALNEARLRPGDKLFPEDIGIDGNGPFIRGCTVNFVFGNSANDTLYLGTASHCVTGMELGAAMALSGGVKGVLAYCSWGTVDNATTCTDKTGAGGASTGQEGFENDFALIAVDPEHRALVHPALRTWGGPTGVAQEVVVDAQVLTYGNSFGRDAGRSDTDAGDAREGYVTAARDWTTTVILGGPSLPGDSGSPVLLANGTALGVVQTLGAGTNGVVNLAPALAYLHEHTELEVRLMTWALLAGPTLPPLP